ncbi:phage antirepressor KilAC domain-containing protein [Paenibacillus larvae]|nr:phage antirepressor KilAC domain-containing protein [Paenibacillus larvae]MDT2237468.1 phage antirepressor KilAC domain-containing protein [Paenibacillus larvae]
MTRDVLPSIRKTGMYAADGPLDNPELLIHVVTKLKEEREASSSLKLRSSQTSQRYCLQMPCQPVKTSILVGDLAKILKQNGVKTGGKRLLNGCEPMDNWIKRQGADYNMPTQRAMEMGLFEIKETWRRIVMDTSPLTKRPRLQAKGKFIFVNKFKEGETA